MKPNGQRPVAYKSAPRINRLTSNKHKRGTKVTQGKELLPGVDGRSLWVRRTQDIIYLIAQDLGGEAELSEAKALMIRRAAVLVTQCERMELRFAAADDPPGMLETYQRTSNSLRRILESIGIERRARDITPTLQEYLKRKSEDDEADA